MNETQFPWREIVAVLHRRRKFILQVFVAGFVTSAIGVWTQQPTYRASATLMVTADRAQIIVSPDANTRPSVERVTEQDMFSELALIKSEALVREVLEPYYDANKKHPASIVGSIMSAITFPMRLPSILYRRLHNIAPATGLDVWVQNTLSGLNVNLVDNSKLIEVAFYSADPHWAAEVVNKVVAKHLERRSRLSQQSEARAFYETQRDILSQQSREAESALEAFNKREGMDAMSPVQRQALRDRLTELQTALANSETELTEGTARVTFLTAEIKNYPKNIATESKIAQNQQFIKPKILELELLRSELLAKYAPTSVKVRDLDRQIAEAKRLMNKNPETLAETTNTINPAYQNLEVDLAQTKAQMAAVSARVETLRTQVAEHKARVVQLDDVGSEQERLEQAVSAAKESFLTYSKKVEEARFSTALDESSFVDLAIAERAEVPTAPLKSKQAFMLTLGTILSLVAGIVLAFVRDRLDPAVKSAAEAKTVTGLPVLAEVR